MKKCKRRFVNHLQYPEMRYYCLAVIILPSKYIKMWKISAKLQSKPGCSTRAVSTAGS